MTPRRSAPLDKSPTVNSRTDRLDDAGRPVGAAIAPADILRAMVAAQLVFTIGNVLTTGAFLYYFANALHPSAFAFSILLITPEATGTVAVWARPVIRWLGSRKRTWLVGFILARLAALGIPAMAIPSLRPADDVAFGVLVVSLGLSHAFQAIAYTAYISWLSDLAPRESWGGVFALRQIANVAVMILLPAAASLLRREWSSWRADEAVRLAYLGVFTGGNVLLWLTIVPILRLPDVPVRWDSRGDYSLYDVAAAAWRWKPLRYVMASSFWLAAAQGLTQGVFFSYQVRVLHLPLEGYLLLSGLMFALQIPTSWLGGWLSDRGFERGALIAGLLAVSGAMGFWLLARPGAAAWLVGAYATWGLFGLVNICQRNLLLKVSPPSDNSWPIAVLEQCGGFVAGAAGLLGGWWLDRLQGSATPEQALRPFAILFIVSWLGRATAPLWLLLMPDHDSPPPDLTDDSGDLGTGRG